MAASSSDRPIHLTAATAQESVCRARQQPAQDGSVRTRLSNAVNALPAAKAASATRIEAPRAIAHSGIRWSCEDGGGARMARESIRKSVPHTSSFAYHLLFKPHALSFNKND
jgi:hypothetical protein